MYLATSTQMRELDRRTIEEYGISSPTLMTAAAKCTANAALSIAAGVRDAVIFCGTGNNGGDGIVCAAFLREAGIQPHVLIVGDRDAMSPDAGRMLRRYEALGLKAEEFEPADELQQAWVAGCGLIVDAIFGIGLSRDVTGLAAMAIGAINDSPAPVVSVDIPSGVEADTGRVLGCAVQADITVTFTLSKPGLHTEPGCLMAGDVRVCEIGVPKELVQSMTFLCRTVEDEEIFLPRRKRDSHKGDFGRDLIVGGSVGFTGAPVFSARSAVRMGAGLVFIGVPKSIYSITAIQSAEAMPFPLGCDAYGLLDASAVPQLLQRLEQCDACLVGPGLGQGDGVTEVTLALLRASKVPLVLDADGINALRDHIDVLDQADCPVILTPHPGEFSRLCGDFLGLGRIPAARAFAQAHRCTLVLKGHRTVIAFPDGHVVLSTAGNPGMAIGGSGDVLAGMILSLLGQGFSVEKAVIHAVYLHGKAGDECARRLGEYSMTPSDMIDILPEVTKSIQR